MKELIETKHDYTFTQKLRELSDAAVSEAEEIIFEARKAPEKDYLTPIPLETIAMLNGYLEDHFAFFESMKEQNPYHADVQRVLHEESIYRGIQRKLIGTLSLEQPDASHYIAFTDREVGTLGEVVGMRHFREEQEQDFDLAPWDEVKYTDESTQILNFFAHFMKAGGKVPVEQISYFGRFSQ